MPGPGSEERKAPRVRSEVWAASLPRWLWRRHASPPCGHSRDCRDAGGGKEGTGPTRLTELPFQDMENKIRSTLNEIYFGKTKDIVNGLR